MTCWVLGARQGKDNASLQGSPDHEGVTFVVEAAEIHAPRFQDLNFSRGGEIFKVRKQPEEIFTFSMITNGQVIDEVVLIVKIEQGFHMHTDLWLLMQNIIDEGFVAGAYLFERTHGQHAAASIKPKRLIRIEEIEISARNIDTKVVTEKIYGVIGRL